MCKNLQVLVFFRLFQNMQERLSKNMIPFTKKAAELLKVIFPFPSDKTSFIHKVSFLGIFIPVLHVVRRRESTIKVNCNAFDDLLHTVGQTYNIMF